MNQNPVLKQTLQLGSNNSFRNRLWPLRLSLVAVRRKEFVHLSRMRILNLHTLGSALVCVGDPQKLPARKAGASTKPVAAKCYGFVEASPSRVLRDGEGTFRRKLDHLPTVKPLATAVLT